MQWTDDFERKKRELEEKEALRKEEQEARDAGRQARLVAFWRNHVANLLPSGISIVAALPNADIMGATIRIEVGEGVQLDIVCKILALYICRPGDILTSKYDVALNDYVYQGHLASISTSPPRNRTHREAFEAALVRAYEKLRQQGTMLS